MDSSSKIALVVDPEPEQRDRCRDFLLGEGFTVVAATNRAEASTYLKEQAVDVVVMDLFLEDGPAYDLFAEGLLQHVSVIGLNNVFRGTTARRLLKTRYPFLDLLDKPLNGAQLIDTLRVHFGRNYPTPPEISQFNKEDQEAFDHIFLTAQHGPPPPPAPQQTTPANLPSGLDWRQLPDRGDLSQVSFPALLTRLLRTRFCGALRLWHERVRKVIFFNDGCPTAGRSNLLYESLGHILIREGLLSPAECEQCVQSAKTQKQRLGEWLQQRGRVTAAQIELALRNQLEARLLDVFNWNKAHYQLHLDDHVPYLVPFDSEQTVHLVFRGVLDWTRPERVMHDLSGRLHNHVRPRMEQRHFENLRANAPQQSIIKAIFKQEGGSLLELVAHFEESAQAYQTVYALIALGYIEFSSVLS